MLLNYASFPNQGLVDGIKNYYEFGIPPGDFLTAVICNDLREACARADHVNRHLLFEIIQWFYWEAPAGTWGSKEVFAKWCLGKQKEVKQAKRDLERGKVERENA